MFTQTDHCSNVGIFPLSFPICWLLSPLGPWEHEAAAALRGAPATQPCLSLHPQSYGFHQSQDLAFWTLPLLTAPTQSAGPTRTANRLMGTSACPDCHRGHVAGCTPSCTGTDHKWLNPQHKHGLMLQLLCWFPAASHSQLRGDRLSSFPRLWSWDQRIKDERKLSCSFFLSKTQVASVFASLHSEKNKSHGIRLNLHAVTGYVCTGSSSCMGCGLCRSLSP